MMNLSNEQVLGRMNEEVTNNERPLRGARMGREEPPEFHAAIEEKGHSSAKGMSKLRSVILQNCGGFSCPTREDSRPPNALILSAGFCSVEFCASLVVSIRNALRG
jgi:hypothetical protein